MRTSVTDREAADVIRARVTMPGLLAAYGLYSGRRARGWTRIPCPLHKGTDKNFSFSDTGYKCWVCGSSGGVIHFVMEYRSMTFREAVRDIDAVCGLGIPFENSEKPIGGTLRKTNLNIHASTLIKNIETRLNAAWRSALENDDREQLDNAQEDLFVFESCGRQRLREYFDYVLNELDGVYDSGKKKMMDAAAKNWKTKDDGKGCVPARAYWPSGAFN